MKEQRPLVWLSSAEGRSEQHFDLQSGWQIHYLDLAQPPHTGASLAAGARVGILDLTRLQRVLPARIDAWVNALPVNFWVGVLAEPPWGNQILRRLVSRYCADYHTLPLDSTRLNTVLGHLWGMAGLVPLDALGQGDHYQAVALTGDSPQIRQVRSLVRRLSQTSETVLIQGPGGTGKEAAARLIHTHSRVSHGPFITVNCAALPVSLTQSELFGYEKGAFTSATHARIGRLEAADGGTLLLTCIDELRVEQQSALLRFLQEGVVERIGASNPRKLRVRILATSSRPLSEVVRLGGFRSDCYYRLGSLEVKMPPLKARAEDIPMLAEQMLAVITREAPPRKLGEDAMQSLLRHDWPGNLKELQNRLCRAVLLSDRSRLLPEDLGLAAAAGTLSGEDFSLDRVRARAEQEALTRSLALSRQNVSAAARLLKISRVSLYRLMEKHGRSPASDAASAQARLTDQENPS